MPPSDDGCPVLGSPFGPQVTVWLPSGEIRELLEEALQAEILASCIQRPTIMIFADPNNPTTWLTWQKPSPWSFYSDPCTESVLAPLYNPIFHVQTSVHPEVIKTSLMKQGKASGLSILLKVNNSKSRLQYL